MTSGRPGTPKLTIEKILDAGLARARTGKEPTLGSIARDLGVHTTSLYNYVRSRDHLVNLLRDHVAITQPAVSSHHSWQDLLRLMSRRLSGVFKLYPGLIAVFATTPVDAPKVNSLLVELRQKFHVAGIDQHHSAVGIRCMYAIVLGTSLDSLDPETSEADADAALQFGIEALVLQLEHSIPGTALALTAADDQ